MANREESDLALLLQLRERLGVDLNIKNISIATEKDWGRVRAFDNSIEATLDAAYGDIRVQSPRAPGVQIRLVDHNNPSFCLAPADALYEITAYKKTEDAGVIKPLNGDVATVYVGKNGIILDEPARIRAAELRLKDLRNK